MTSAQQCAGATLLPTGALSLPCIQAGKSKPGGKAGHAATERCHPFRNAPRRSSPSCRDRSLDGFHFYPFSPDELGHS
jgi:hypothetical protein